MRCRSPEGAGRGWFPTVTISGEWIRYLLELPWRRLFHYTGTRKRGGRRGRGPLAVWMAGDVDLPGSKSRGTSGMARSFQLQAGQGHTEGAGEEEKLAPAAMVRAEQGGTPARSGPPLWMLRGRKGKTAGCSQDGHFANGGPISPLIWNPRLD